MEFQNTFLNTGTFQIAKNFLILGLSSKNCTNKVKTVLLAQNIAAEISSDLSLINLQGPNLDVAALNSALNKVGNYFIAKPVNRSEMAKNTVAQLPQNVKKTTIIRQNCQFFNNLQTFNVGFFLYFTVLPGGRSS